MTTELILSPEHVSILAHTVLGGGQQVYCGDSPEMQELVSLGLMKSLGRVSWCPDEYFTITGIGRKALKLYRPTH